MFGIQTLICFLVSRQYIEPTCAPVTGRGAHVQCNPQGVRCVEAGHTAHLRGIASCSQHQRQPGRGGRHLVVVCLWFPWWYVTIWWRRGVVGPCLLPRTWNGWGHTLWCWWALDTGQPKPWRFVGGFFFRELNSWLSREALICPLAACLCVLLLHQHANATPIAISLLECCSACIWTSMCCVFRKVS